MIILISKLSENLWMICSIVDTNGFGLARNYIGEFPTLKEAQEAIDKIKERLR